MNRLAVALAVLALVVLIILWAAPTAGAARAVIEVIS